MHPGSPLKPIQMISHQLSSPPNGQGGAQRLADRVGQSVEGDQSKRCLAAARARPVFGRIAWARDFPGAQAGVLIPRCHAISENDVF